MTGAKKGFYIMGEIILSALIWGFALVKVLEIWRLRGNTSVLSWQCLVTGRSYYYADSGIFRQSGRSGHCGKTYTARRAFTATQATILFPVTIMMGTFVGNFIRVIMVTQTSSR